MRHSSPTTRTVFAVWILVWLNVVLQPCVMAASIVSTRAPDVAHQHHAQETDAAHGHARNHGDCPHCGLFGNGDCAYGGCAEPDVVKPSSGTELKDASSKPAALAVVAGSYWALAQRPIVTDDIASAEPPPEGPPISIRYCVYLK
ncbi:MAG TPA: hypothetical protein PKK10_08225 [Woeseiaceae bacterium]|nr:hypothetical protein [Woeseiaceae bacterium]